jgi:uncharacterized protein
MSDVFFSKDIDKILQKIDYSVLGKNVGIKVHFGEEGCVTYLDPSIAKKVYDKIISLGKKAALIETNVLYRGSRTTKTEHIKTAKSHGFDFAPIDILDGENGEESINKDGNLLGKGLTKYDSLVVITHFKGHEFAGYGGAIKNIGMGLASRGGKLHIHSDAKPIISEKCIGCGTCIQNCNENAISLKNNKAVIDTSKCVGCAMCIAVCPSEAVLIPWRSPAAKNLQKALVDYTESVFKIVPKEKVVFINVLKNITANCDCMSEKQKPFMEDIGLLMSKDIVSIEKASIALADKKSDGAFSKINRQDKNIQSDYAFEKKLGEKSYRIIASN